MTMTRLAFLTALCCSLLYLTAARAQTLWNGTSYGMSFNQVMKTVPEATAPVGTPDTYTNGAVERLAVPDVKVGSYHFVATFVFLGDKLEKVVLHLKSVDSYSTAQVAFGYLATALRSKYGREVSHEEEPAPFGTGGLMDATWVSGKTDIAMAAIGLSESDAWLDITYEVKLSRERNNL